MTQYFFVDESGDAGLEGQASSSSHFVMAMVQLPERAPLKPLVDLRKELKVSPYFEFKFHQSKSRQKDLFFRDILKTSFRVRAVVVNKTRIDSSFRTFSPRELTLELIVGLTMRADELDIANEILIIDGATPAFCRDLRVILTERYKSKERVRPFKNIIGADSKNEDGLQLADMIAGVIRSHSAGDQSEHFQAISSRIVDLWQFP